jgi:hypothetical protein
MSQILPPSGENLSDDDFQSLSKEDYLDQWYFGKLPAQQTDELLGSASASLKKMHLDAIQVIYDLATLQQIQEVQKNYLQRIQPAIAPPQKAKIFKLLRPARIAAAVLILVFAGTSFFLFQSTRFESLSNTLPSNYNFDIDRSSGNRLVDLEDSLQLLFNKKQYQRVVELAQQNPSVSSNKLSFIQGMAHFELQQYAAAIPFLELVEQQREIADKPKLYQDEAMYYLLLSHLHLKEKDKALYWANKIKSDPEHTYYVALSQNFMKKLNWAH